MHYAAQTGVYKEHDETLEASQEIDPSTWHSLHQTRSLQLKLLAQPRTPIHGVDIIRANEDGCEAQDGPSATVKGGYCWLRVNGYFGEGWSAD